MFALLPKAERRSGVYGRSPAALAGQDTEAEFAEKIGSMSYTEGCVTPASDPANEKGDNNMIRITMQNGKTIDIELDPKAAPITCENFEKLVKQGFTTA